MIERALRIERVRKVNSRFIKEFNAALDADIIWDEKVVWDEERGSIFVTDPRNALIVAYFENQLAGFLTAHRLQRFDSKKAEVFIYDVGVRKDFRQMGIGKALIDAIKKWASEQGADNAWVITNKSNKAAMSFYASTGGVEDEPDLTMFTYKIKK